MNRTFLAAVDMSADSGRIVLGGWDGYRLTETVLHRFTAATRDIDGTLRWDHRALATGMLAGLTLAVRAARDAGGHLAGIGISTWGSDYVLLGADDEPVEAPWHYRDPRTKGVRERIAETIPEAEQWQRTGTSPRRFNTIYQLVAARATTPQIFDQARRLVTMADWLRGLLCGIYACEWTQANTTGLTTAGLRAWDRDLLARLNLPDHLFDEILASGTILGPVRPAIAGALGCLGAAPLVIATPGHDTAAAAAAIPGDDPGGAFLSSHTWSLLGRLERRPNLDPATMAAGFTNEIAHDGRTHLLRVITGLWILQECRRGFAESGHTWTSAALHDAALAVDPGVPLDVDDPRFFSPGTTTDPMPARVRSWYAERGLPLLPDDATVARRVLEGLTESHRRAVTDLVRLSGRPITCLHLLGSGTTNTVLCRLTAQAIGRPVIAGPTEATALGTLLCAGQALGWYPLDRIPRIAALSTEVRRYDPLP